MDLQGNPTPPGRRSTKVTQVPEAARNPVRESGSVINDSLAAESTRSGGAYSQNRRAEPLGVAGNQSTLNNTDTSGANELSSASSGATREDRDKQERYPEALGGQGNFPGTHVPETGYTGGSTAAKQSMGINQGAYPASQKVSQSESESESQSQPQAAEASGSGYRSEYNGGQAPPYIQHVTGQLRNTKPKGKNLQEGGFDSDPNNNASFTSEIGSDQDPGRYGENYSQRKAVENGAPDVARGPTEKGIDDKTWYQPLESDQRA